MQPAGIWCHTRIWDLSHQMKQSNDVMHINTGSVSMANRFVILMMRPHSISGGEAADWEKSKNTLLLSQSVFITHSKWLFFLSFSNHVLQWAHSWSSALADANLFPKDMTSFTLLPLCCHVMPDWKLWDTLSIHSRHREWTTHMRG
jgi:hypothetical protein